MEKKKILFIIWSYSNGGGAEALLTMIVNHLDSEKYDVSILEIVHFGVKKEVVNSNVTILDYITSDSDVEYTKKMYYIYAEPDVMVDRYIQQKYDLYVSFNYQTPSFLLPKGKRNIAWLHGSLYELQNVEMEGCRRCQDIAFDKACKIISISDITTQSVEALFPAYTHKLVELYNCIDIGRVEKLAECPSSISFSHPAIIYVGRLDGNKNPLRALAVFRRVQLMYPEVHLYFIGRGELEGAVRKAVDYYNLTGCVHLLGYIENPYPLVRQAKVMIMMSHSEGFPMSLLEGIALAVPFVSTEVGGARILSNNETCGKVIKSDEEAADAILKYLSTDVKYIRKICEASIKRFTMEDYIKKVEDIFDAVLNKFCHADANCTSLNNIPAGQRIFAEKPYYYQFPTHLIMKGQKVVLYGAGKIGTDYNAFIGKTGYCKMILWVDRQDKKYREMGMDICSIDIINTLEYDAILISVMNIETVMEIENDLLTLGVSKEKIRWSMPCFI